MAFLTREQNSVFLGVGILKETLYILIDFNEFIRFFRKFTTYFLGVNEQVLEVTPILLNFTEVRDNIVH